MPYFLAVDAGGTKTEFLLADEHRELARVKTGTIKRLRTNADTTMRNLRDALEQLEAMTGVAMQEVASCCIGTSGETVPLVVEWLQQSFGRLVGGELRILGDVEIALNACFLGGRGVLVLAGTGSNIAGRGCTGKIVTAGGWGPALADQGSGHFVGLEGLRRGFLARDQGRPTRLLDAAMAFWRLTELGELIELANANPAPIFSDFAPSVVACAAQGDEVAQEVLAQGGTELAYLTGLVFERIRGLEFAAGMDEPFDPPKVAIAGSILANVAPLRQAMKDALRKSYPKVEFVEEPADAVLGALWRARLGR